MKDIITELDRFYDTAEPLKFSDDKGLVTAEGDEIIKELKETLGAHEDVFALSAPQIGYPKRIVALKFNDGIKIFINPIITKKSGSSLNIETFASMPGKEILITRPTEVSVIYYTEKYQYEDNKLLGVAAALFDQQAQLLDGVTPELLGLVSDIEKDGKIGTLEPDEQQALADLYKQVIAARMEALKKDIDTDSELQRQYRIMKFSEDVINGRAQVVDVSKAKKSDLAEDIANNSMARSAKEKKAANQAELNAFLRRKHK